MAAVQPEDLNPGTLYRIDHTRGRLMPRVGRFVGLVGTPPNVNARFRNIKGPNTFTSPESAYRADEWTFRKSGQTLAAEKVAVAIGLPRGENIDPSEHDHALPDDLEREVGKHLGGRRTRKHKRRARKTRRSHK